MVKICGREHDGFEDKTISEMLEQLGYKTVYIAVELNGDIIKRDSYGTTVIKENDNIEVVNFVGGG